MPKKLIVCCDGTGNEIRENQSNVLKFYRVLKEDYDQITFYDPGVGTISDSGAWASIRNKIKGVFGLLTGYGLDANILSAYQFLIQNYEEGDEIYLFGFSRGAHTVRALAGFINLVGLLQGHQKHLSSYVLTAYKQSSNKRNLDKGRLAQEVMNTRRATIRFMGCWDTVASVIVPRPDRFFIPSLEDLPFTSENPCVQVFRHALAIDERRRMFRVARWMEPQMFKSNPFVKDANAVNQDIKQVCFAGVHSDIGGGYRETDSGAAKYPLGWMVDEAREHGLIFRERMVKRLVNGDNPSNVEEGSKRDYAEPTPTSTLHDSMNWAWSILEYIPRRKSKREDPEKREPSGFYLPRSEQRYFAANVGLHNSVRARIDATAGKDKYNPPNLP